MIHSIIPPSSAHIWGKPDGCTGWVLMSQQYPEVEEPQDAKDGTASHEIAFTLIDHASRGMDLSFKYFDGKTATNDELFTEEMFDAAEIYALNVIAIMRKHRIFGGPTIGIEQRLEIKRIHEMAFGTPDSWIYNPKSKHLYIWDYKFGYLIYEAFENWQLLTYLAGIFDKLKINGILNQEITVHMRIIQPRAFHHKGIIREWVTKGSNLRAYFNILNAKANEALSSESVIRSGSHCRYCQARHACPAALKGGISLYEVAAQPLAIELSPDALGVQLAIVKRAISQLEYIESGLTEQVKGLIRNRTIVPGWEMQSGQGKEIWDKPAEEVIELGKLLKYNLSKPPAAITPKQARAKGIDDLIIKQYSKTQRTALTLVPNNGNKAKRLFQ